MIAITFNGNDAFLIDNAPSWDGAVTLTVSRPSHTETGLTGRETRRPLADVLRLGLRYTTIIAAGELPAFRNALQALSTEKVLCPLWVAGFEAGTAPAVTAPFYVLMGDGLAPEIKADAQRPFARPAYPLLVGALDEIPNPSLYTDEVAEVEINFIENGVYPITPPAYAASITFDAAGQARPLFPWRPNWATKPKSGKASVEIERRDIGQGREMADAYYDQPSRREANQAFTLVDSEPWQFLSFFQDQGSTGSFWLPSGISDARLLAEVAGDNFLLVDHPEARGGNTTFVLDDLAKRQCITVTGNGPGRWDLSQAVPVTFYAGQTRIESIFLARLDKNEITIKFHSPTIAEVTLAFKEVPWEDETVADEIIGTTMGEKPTTAYLYQFSITFPDTVQRWYFTDFETTLSDGANAFVPAPIEHDSITESDSIERQSLTLTSRYFLGNPLSLLLPFALEWPLMLKIYECSVNGSDASNLFCLFNGEVTKASYDGPYIRATCSSLSPLLDRKIPRRLLQTGCNWILFEPGCTLNRNDWKWQGTVTAFNANTLEIALAGVSRVSGPAIALTQHYFASGYLTIGAGASVQYRMIADNPAAVGNTLTLVAATPFTITPQVGQVVYFHPGCDGLYSTCGDKFNNKLNFGGFPFMPVGNPSLSAVSNSSSSGGKK